MVSRVARVVARVVASRAVVARVVVARVVVMVAAKPKAVWGAAARGR